MFESLEAIPRVIAPMAPLLRRAATCVDNEALPWARLDLEAMAGPYAVFTLDSFRDHCDAAHPEGSTARRVLDLNAGESRVFSEPAGVRTKLRNTAEQLLAKSCQGLIEESRADREGFGLRYDGEGDLVAEYGFLGLSSYSCHDGIVHVRVGSFDLPQELLPYSRLPGWLRAWLKAHPSNGVSVIPVGGEERAKTQFLALSAAPAPLPVDSGSGDTEED